jgi:hypothetical protein
MNAIIDGATTDGGIGVATTTTVATMVTAIADTMGAVMRADRVNMPGTCVAFTIRTDGQAIPRLLETSYRDCAERNEPAAVVCTATTPGTDTTSARTQ